MRLKYTFAGTKPTKVGLVVFFEVVTGGARRVQSLMVPWSELTDHEALEAIADQQSAEMQDRWGRLNAEAQPFLPWD